MACPECAKAEGGKCMVCEIAEVAKSRGFLQQTDLDKAIKTFSEKQAEHQNDGRDNTENSRQHQNTSVADVLNSMHEHDCGDSHCAINNAKNRIAGEAFASGVNKGMRLGSQLEKRGLSVD